MENNPLPDPRHVVLVTHRQELARRVTSVLEAADLSVRHARDGEELWQRLSEGQPDAVVLDGAAPLEEVLDLCRQVVAEPRLESVTPVVVLTDTPEGCGDILRAGAWDCLRLGGDANELALKLRRFTGAKREVDLVKGTSLLDAETDLYNVRGLIRRLRETGAAADRYEGPLACMALSVSPDPSDDRRAEEQYRDIAIHLDDVRRSSDVVGRLGPGLFAIVGPGTGPGKAARMAERILAELDARLGGSSPGAATRMHAGYAAVSDFHQAGVQPVEILTRALRALQAVQDHPAKQIRGFSEELPPFRDTGMLTLR